MTVPTFLRDAALRGPSMGHHSPAMPLEISTRCTSAYLIPLRLSPFSWPAHGQGDLLQTDIAGVDDAGRRPNLSRRAIAYVESLEGDCPLPEMGDSVWLHVLAVGYAAAYL